MISAIEQGRRDKIARAKTKHGHAGGRSARSKEYHIWSQMLQRCENPLHKDFPRYGGVGIAVSNDWHDFSAFLADMGPQPQRGWTLERKDNRVGYVLGNVVWADRKTQARNRSSTIWTTVDGLPCTLTEACMKLGVSYGMVRGRLRLGWTIDDALSVPKSSNTRARV